ncbi:serine protein kinase PrkA [Geomesophilobacter sediminis]|uniref:Serine protein kinase PrkA n=1 Tax=Geomesophilobacter sediminis TaxID=2798584 RepID=A0A8J7M0R3_9BACT|nr:serine protein kinase PrkA [Geomesophilobacter sediminis]MBJ6726482.1 serine protein kinase PrkA [Geomesophilobacter sediminis]
MADTEKVLRQLSRAMVEREVRAPLTFEEYLQLLTANPQAVMRNIFQIFHDMVHSYVGEGADEYPDDPESINFVNYDCRKLFVENSDRPFFADRLFANRLMNHVAAMKSGARQNKIYIFEGPPGSGKSTFLNNLLMKFEEYASTEAGRCYEVVWRLDRRILGRFKEHQVGAFMEKLSHLLDEYELEPQDFPDNKSALHRSGDYVEVACPSHDSPILMINKAHRRAFFDDLFQNDSFKWRLFTEKEFDWVFKDSPCTICSSLLQALLSRLDHPSELFKMIYVRPYRFNRRLGEGITVFNPGDRQMKQNIQTNELLQRKIDLLLRDSNEVKYLYSNLARTNNGIYALMDVKAHNAERLLDLHNIISEGIHKVEDLEENVRSLFIALMNPEDERTIEGVQSFTDRIEFINIPYVMDLNTEVEIYRNIFGKHIDTSFLPRVLHNFARVIISTRMNIKSDALLEWIGDPSKYRLYCDEKLQILKMEIYTGHIPSWLTEEDRKRLTAKRRRRIIAESEHEGDRGFSGRESIKIFSDFYSAYARKDKMINMSHLVTFFTRWHKELKEAIPEGFLDSLVHNYDYQVLQEVKESLYYYNEEQIERDILNYMFAVNFEIGSVEICRFTGEKLEITEEFLTGIEGRLLGGKADYDNRMAFRLETQKEYTGRALTQEILVDGKSPKETHLYESLHERYVFNLKEKVLEPFLENANFRRAIKDYDTEAFKTYDKRIRDDVTFLINNLSSEKFKYTKQAAKEICVYVIDNDLARKFHV